MLIKLKKGIYNKVYQEIMKKIICVLSLILFGITLTGCDSNDNENKEEGAVTVVDDNNNTTVFDEAPSKVAIVGLPPMVSFYLQFVGDVERLALIPAGPVVTQTSYYNTNFDLTDVATTGWMGSYDVESVLAAEPDLVITSSLSSHYETLRAAGIKTVGFSWGDDVISEAKVWTKRLGQIFELENKADEVIEKMESLETLVDSKLESVKMSQLMH